jgi:hypothetical protein
MKVVAHSKLITLIKFGNNTKPKIPKASIMLFSLMNRVTPLSFKHFFYYLPLQTTDAFLWYFMQI